MFRLMYMLTVNKINYNKLYCMLCLQVGCGKYIQMWNGYRSPCDLRALC